MVLGTDPESSPRAELRFLLKILMVFRVVAVTLFLGVTVVAQVKGSQVLFISPLYFVYLLIVSVYLLTIFFASVFSQVQDIKRFGWFQIATDLVLYTSIIFLSGGYESPFPFLYLFSILWASLAFPGRGGYWTASISAILYGALIDLEYYGLLIPKSAGIWYVTGSANPWDLLGRVALYISAFFAVAFLGHQMARRYRSTEEALTEKTADLEKLRNLSDMVFESINSGIVVLDREEKIRLMNTAAAGILGVDRDQCQDVSGGSVFNNIPIRELCLQSVIGHLNRWEGEFIGQNGGRRIIGLSISQLKDPEGWWVVIFQDLSEIREMEGSLKRAAKLSAIGRMAASIAHEIRNPLASMSGSIQILKGSLNLGREDSQLMEIVLRETERMNALVGNFLDYARPPSPRLVEEDLRKIVADTVHFLKGSAVKKDASLVSSLPRETLLMKVDPAQIRQIIINLVKNALEAMHNGGEVNVRLEKARHGDYQGALLSISDDGCGIPEEMFSEIFEPFKTSKPGGTGLGLAIVYQLVSIHNGNIDVSTEVGKGTTFSIFLPSRRRK